MSKASQPPAPPSAASGGRFVEYDQFIDQQVDKTRSHVRGIDITGALMTLAAGMLAFFLVATLLDHWLIPGGLGSWGRTLLCAALTIGITYYAAIELVPLCLKRINPIYAAQAIERATPSLKNGLVNFLLLKSHRAALSEPVFDAIEEQAATGLARVSVDATVDRSRLIKLGYVLVALVAVAAFYKVLSPKDPLTTVGRVVLPWSDIQPPTRVSISDVTPGASEAFRGQQIEISAAVRGLKSDGEVRLVFATADGQTVDQQIRMTMPASSTRYMCSLPESTAGLQQDLDYHLEAGDARTPTYRVTVVAAPTIVVQSVDYVFPDYTGLAPQTIEQQADIKGIEGTRVTLHALANQDIKSGAIDFNCDGREDQQLSIDGQKATVSFTLELSEDRRTAAYANYRLRFRNMAGQENPQPIAHRIEVTPDLPPEIEFLAPKNPELDVPARSSVGFEVVANDPDFALRQVRLMAKVGEKQIFDKLLLDEPRAGQFSKKLWFGTARTELKPGDVVEYWAVAEDVKTPKPNHVETAHRRLRIMSASERQNKEDQLANRDEEIRPENSGKAKPDDDQQGDSKSSQQGKADSRDAGKQGAAGNEGDQKDNQDAGGNKQKSDRQRDKGDRGAGEDPAGEKDRQQPGEQPPPGEQKQGDQKSGEGAGQQGAGEKQKGSQSGQQGGKGEDEGGTPADGTDDGSAIEKILQDRQQSGKGEPEGNNTSENGKQDGKQGDKQSGERGGNQGKAESGNSKSGGKQESGGSADKNSGGAGSEKSQPQAGEKSDQAQRPDGNSGDDAERPQQGSGPSGLNPLKKQEGDKGAGGNSKKGLGQQGPGDRPGSAEGQQDDTEPPNQPGGVGSKNEPAGGNDNKPGDKSQQGSGSGPEQRRPGSKPTPESGEPRSQQNGAGNGQSQPADQEKGGDKDGGQTQRGGPNDRGQQGERQPAKPDDASKEAGGNPQGRDPQTGDPQSRQPADGSKPGERNPAQERKPRPDEKTGRTEKGTGDKGQAERDPGKKPGQEPGQKPQRQPESPIGQGKPNDPASEPGEPNEPQSKNPNDEGQQPGSGQGQGGKSEGGTGRKPQKSSNDSQQQPDAKGGDSEDNKGQSGAGNSSQDKQGSPAAQGNNQQRDKTQQGGGGRNAMQPNDSSQSPSNSERQSDSQGESSGDRAGGGGKGGGQKANKSGTGGAGQNTAADEGAGKSDEPGDGETGDKAGDRKQSDGTTGKSGTERGQGSSSRTKPNASGGGEKPPGEARREGGEQGDQPNKGAQGKPPGEKPQRQSPDKSQPASGEKPEGQKKPGQAQQQPPGGSKSEKQPGAPGNQPGHPGGAGSGQPTGGGTEGQQSPVGPEAETPTAADDPNLEYARKATDLALEHLKDQLQRGEPDQELLDKLKWSRQDAEKFVNRLDEMRRKANQRGQEGQAGRKELDDYLRSLGVRPRSTKLQANKGHDDQSRGLKESRRSQPPAEYAEQFKAYTQGTSRGGK